MLVTGNIPKVCILEVSLLTQADEHFALPFGRKCVPLHVKCITASSKFMECSVLNLSVIYENDYEYKTDIAIFSTLTRYHNCLNKQTNALSKYFLYYI